MTFSKVGTATGEKLIAALDALFKGLLTIKI